MSIPSEQLQIVQSILQKHVPQRSVLAFGSRVQGNAKPYSDLDFAILGNEPLSIAEHADLTSDAVANRSKYFAKTHPAT
ncbi:nucleotidyltransferase domain-containing protein [Conchiformibius steedae DSM 2580]|uniref:Nucleotidyltransferase domain-containing protein n=1 Tax=Conchiformibius steedae DSM 2580 TaxID=1121352 RepID=A0AAE9KZA0_9NEIS|nr:nucleotidyltransferase domain-containing protein [Conchiformibius steedae]URD67116.1 nucleotidyltransferase domain-containing protein [Conchiformibius steedae DSM 2580]